tara:strand:- start:590 stop:1159 length:570 start_codon:yes stop_codon:yes gene_type:complete
MSRFYPLPANPTGKFANFDERVNAGEAAPAIGARMERLRQMTEAARPQPKNSSKTVVRSQETPSRPMTAAEAVAAVRAEERSRIMAVFDSPQVAGCEFGAAFLLSHTNIPAPEIIENLSRYSISHDSFRELSAAMSNPSSKSGNHGWNDIHAEIRERRETQSSSSTKPEANHGWGDIHAKIQSTRGAVQ